MYYTCSFLELFAGCIFLSFEAWVHHPVGRAWLATYPRLCLCGVIITPWQPVGQNWWEVTIVVIANSHSSLIETLSSTDWNSSYDSLYWLFASSNSYMHLCTGFCSNEHWVLYYVPARHGRHNDDSYATTEIIANRYYHIDLLHTSSLKLKCFSVEYHSAPAYNYMHIILLKYRCTLKLERKPAYEAFLVL